MKKFNSVDEQIEKLKSRNVNISNEQIARRYLELNNYYNVINCCARPFLQNKGNSEMYKDGSNFYEIIAIHKFENAIKQDILENLLLIEKHLKSTIAHVFSKYHQEPFSCLDKDSYNFNTYTILDISTLISLISKKINEQTKQKEPNSVKHYIRDHKDIPMYVLIDHFTFGNIVSMFKIMKFKERAEIIGTFNKLLSENIDGVVLNISPHNFDTMLANLLSLRNTTAHNSSLFSFSTRANISYIPALHDKYRINATSSKQNLYSNLITFACFLPSNDFKKFYNSILKRSKKLNNKLHTISVNEIYMKLGFPIGFHTYPNLMQIQQ